MKSAIKRLFEISTITSIAFIVGAILGAYFVSKFEIPDSFELQPILKNNETNISSTRIIFLGDMMLDRHVAIRIDQFGQEYPFKDIKDFLKSSDFVVVNAEGVFSSNKSITKGVSEAPLTFTFDIGILKTLKELGFSALSQANNHNMDFGERAKNESKLEIEKAGIQVFGDYFNETPGPIFLEKGSEIISVIGFNEFAYKNKEKVIDAIKFAKGKSKFAVVFAHWGSEYEIEPNNYQKSLAREFIDSGADLIIGAHSHVIQPIEIYKNKAIFYSLGNFVFDQGFGETTKGLAVRMNLDERKVFYELIPLKVGIGNTVLAYGSEKSSILEKLNIKEGLLSLDR